MFKRLTVIICCIAMIASALVGCAQETNGVPDTETPEKTDVVKPTEDGAQPEGYPKPNLNITEVFGPGPYGEEPAQLEDLEITDEEAEQLKAGNFKVAFVYHMLTNEVNQIKIASAKTIMEEYGIEVVCESNAEGITEKLVSNLETAIALRPDVIVTMPLDPDATAPICRKALEEGIKLVFMESVCTGFEPGKDYVTMCSSDSYGNGKFAAEYMAYLIGPGGQCAMAWQDQNLFCVNERDRAFRETMANKFPEIEIVFEAGYTDHLKAGPIGDAIFAKYPDIEALYATWTGPAEQVLAAGEAYGRGEDLIITSVDLDDNAARIIAEDGPFKAIGAPRSYETGLCEGYAICYALLGKQVPSTYICTPTQACTKENILEAYEICFRREAPQELKDIVAKNQ